jgi:hypothetical protein
VVCTAEEYTATGIPSFDPSIAAFRSAVGGLMVAGVSDEHTTLTTRPGIAAVVPPVVRSHTSSALQLVAFVCSCVYINGCHGDV